MFQGRVNFIPEFVPWATGACAFWAAALDHEVFDDPMEYQAIVIRAFPASLHRAFGQAYKIANGKGAFFKFQ
jgi:hypothetical protein